MEIEFRDKLLADLYEGKVVSDRRFKSNQQLVNQYIKTVNKLHNALRIEDLYQLHSLNYEKLVGSREGQSSVRINDKYRLVFEEVQDSNSKQVVLLALEEISNHYS
jgi:proteic killer suppression protein